MITVTGKIEDATGATLHAKIDFVSKSTPLAFSGGVVVTNTDKSIRSNPSDGTFAVQLEPGNYSVTITANSQTTTFNIAVPDGSSSVSIEQLVATPLAFAFTPPNTIWNGVRMGHITFVPVANPPTGTCSPIVFGGGHQGNTDLFAYQVAWANANGDVTKACGDFTNSPPASPNNATRVHLPSPPSGVTGVIIYRSTNDSTLNRYQLAVVTAATTFYDDWESTDDFNARLDATALSPAYNNTAGKLLSSAGAVCAEATDQGLIFPGANIRVTPGMGIQIYNFDTRLWHTLLVSGNPPQLGLDAGNPN